MQPTQPSASERIARAQNAINQPVSCPECGSTWFYEVTFQQYSKSTYSSSPGGDLKTISVMPQQLRMCACGSPITPNIGGTRGGRTPNGELASFFDSLQGAVETRKKRAGDTPTALINKVALREDLVTSNDAIRELQARVAELEAAAKAPKTGKTAKTEKGEA